MKYEIYKKLTKEQKEEYRYRFKDKLETIWMFPNIMMNFIVFGLVATILVMGILALHLTNALDTKTIEAMLKTVSLTIKLIFYVSIIQYVINSIERIITIIQYKKWIKKNNLMEKKQ